MRRHAVHREGHARWRRDAYRWSHPPGKPSELLLRLKNVSGADKRVSLGIDLYYQGRTVEAFEADTCLRPGMLLAGRLNGIYFIPRALTTGRSRMAAPPLRPPAP
ncbi:MAG: hypothetical protein IPM46_01120 [Flavobacteriales bacterium]|nr:hypothetical protein [Flavobacteriales bacterium]